MVCVGVTWAMRLDSPDYLDPNPSYAVAWEVKNEPTYDEKSQQEVLQEGTVEGRYTYLRPDGKRQVVTYRANDEIGFVVNIEVHDVMTAFGDGGRPPLASNVGSGRSLDSVSYSGSSTLGRKSLNSFPSSRDIVISSFSSSSFSPSSSSGRKEAFMPASSPNVNHITPSEKDGSPLLQIPTLQVPAVMSQVKNPNIQPTQHPLSFTSKQSSPTTIPSFVRSSSVIPESFHSLPAFQNAFVEQLPFVSSTARLDETRPALTKGDGGIVTKRLKLQQPVIRPSTARLTPPPPTSPTPTSTVYPHTTTSRQQLPPTSIAPHRQPAAFENTGHSITGAEKGSLGHGETTGVAHVSFSSPTHQYSYPLIVN